MKCTHSFFLWFLALATLTGCTPSLSPDTYNTPYAGRVQRVARGVVIGARIVSVSDSQRDMGVGTLAGGALGAIAGSQIGGGNGSLAAGIGGAVLGGLAGSHVQQGLTKQNAVEYVIRLRDKSLVSIVQGLRPFFNRGQHVLVQFVGYGGRSRVIADPEYAIH